MSLFTIKNKAALFIAGSFLLLSSIGASAQTVVTHETFPNQFNTSFPYNNNSNGTFVGSSGTWTASCNSNALSAIAVLPAYYSPVTKAIKIVNWNTAGKGAADCHAASPTVNLSSYTCSPNLNLSFKLYTYKCSSSDPNSFFRVEFSTNSGSTWTSMLSLSAAQLRNAYGEYGLTTLTVDIPAAYRVSGFKYRFSGYKPANQGNNLFLFVDEAKINATACNTCSGSVNSLYFNELNGGADLPITNGSTFTVTQLGSLYNLEVGTTGTVGSVKYTISGPTATSNIENAAPYNSPGTGNGAWTGTVGSYTVNLKTYSGAGATGSLCHDTTITFNLTTSNCYCPGANMVSNPGFENGTTNWSWSGGSLNASTGAVECGSFSGDLNNTSVSSKAWQLIGTDLPVGTIINTSVYAGTHNNSFNNWVAVEFLNASNVVLGTSVYVQVDKVLANSPAGPQLYTFSATVPSGAKYTRVAFGGNGSYTKTDQWCVTSTPTSICLGNRVWYDTDNDGINDASEDGIRNVTVKLYRDNNNDNVADGASIATTVTDEDGYYTFSNLTPGNYIVGAVIPNGYMSSSINGGDPDNNINLDDNGQVSAGGNEVRGLTITITAGGEPNGNTNNTYDFGMLPNCACVNSTANKLVNASFENGTSGWSWSSANGSLTTGTGYVACGTKNGFNNQSSGTSKVWQDVNIVAGSMVTFSAFAGTHAPGIACNPKLSLIFLNSENEVVGQHHVTVTRVVGDYHNQLEQYSITAFAPSGTVKVRVQSTITCNTMKLDAFCLTATEGGPLAITLSEFTAAKNSCTANLNWKTSSEVNGNRFEVEVSTNNNAVYTTAGTVMAAGNSTTTRSYQYSYLMQPGVNYLFRLKMIDKDGSFKYSDIRSLNCTIGKGIVIAPNPVVTRFTINGMENGKNYIAVYDANGKVMKTQVIAQSQGEVNISNLAPGLYTLKVTSETGNSVINKIVKY